MRKFKLKRTKSKPGLINIKQSNDIILNGEHEFKHEEQHFQLSANTSSNIEKYRNTFEDALQAASGAPDVNRFIYSSFDVKPFNAQDVNYQQYLTGFNNSTYLYPKLKFTVPKNTVFIARSFAGDFDVFAYGDATPDPLSTRVAATVIINGAADPYNSVINSCYVGSVAYNQAYSTFFFRETQIYYVLNEFSTIEILFGSNGTDLTGVGLYARLYGNLLKKTGVPANFETGFDTNALTTFKNR